MNPELWDIFLCPIQWGNSADERPCILISSANMDLVTIAPLSSAMTLFDRARHFKIEKEHTDFAATGLSRTSYVAGDELRQIKVSTLKEKLGRLEGGLKLEFIDWIG